MNANVDLTLDEAVGEVLGLLTGMELAYDPQFDRYRSITRFLNRALRQNALEHEWSYYSSTETVGIAQAGDRDFALRASIRPRIIGDDAVRLVAPDGTVVVWAYILPRDALHKYNGRYNGLWASITRTTLSFSRPLSSGMEGLEIQVPVMREPRMFQIPAIPSDPDDPMSSIPQEIRDQTVDFDFPDVVVLRAAYLYAQSDPIMQPRVQTLEAQYKDLMYQLIERDDRHTDSPFINDFFVPISNSVDGGGSGWYGLHPHGDERR